MSGKSRHCNQVYDRTTVSDEHGLQLRHSLRQGIKPWDDGTGYGTITPNLQNEKFSTEVSIEGENYESVLEIGIEEGMLEIEHSIQEDEENLLKQLQSMLRSTDNSLTYGDFSIPEDRSYAMRKDVEETVDKYMPSMAEVTSTENAAGFKVEMPEKIPWGEPDYTGLEDLGKAAYQSILEIESAL